jgi:hypothetical protein
LRISLFDDFDSFDISHRLKNNRKNIRSDYNFTCNTASGVDIIPPHLVTLALGNVEHHWRTSEETASPPTTATAATAGDAIGEDKESASGCAGLAPESILGRHSPIFKNYS